MVVFVYHWEVAHFYVFVIRDFLVLIVRYLTIHAYKPHVLIMELAPLIITIGNFNFELFENVLF